MKHFTEDFRGQVTEIGSVVDVNCVPVVVEGNGSGFLPTGTVDGE